MKLWLFALLFGAFSLVFSQNLTAVPACAQTCLQNSTASAGSCSSLDIKCLCSNAEYVNTLSCCLATTCSTADQQKAIEFNVAECATVNESAPSFVGCSPLGLESSVVLGGAGTSSSATQASMASMASMASTSMSMDMGLSSNSLISTVTGSVGSVPTTYAMGAPITAAFNGKSSILTGSCTHISFALATDSMAMVTEFAQMGCSEEMPGCCPGFEPADNAVLTQCPADYFTTAGACCPSGWQIYFSSIGSQTPCYTMPMETFVPAMTATISGLTVITEHVYTRKFELTEPKSSGLSTGSKAGLAAGSCIAAFLLTGFAIFLFRRRRASQRQEQQQQRVNTMNSIAAMSERPFSPAFPPAPQELASPENGVNSPALARNEWPINSTSPPAYNQSVVARNPLPEPVKAAPPQELPGSTFIHEHHPAYTSDGESQQQQSVTAVTAPSSPLASLPRKSTTVSPLSSPLASPKIL